MDWNRIPFRIHYVSCYKPSLTEAQNCMRKIENKCGNLCIIIASIVIIHSVVAKEHFPLKIGLSKIEEVLRRWKSKSDTSISQTLLGYFWAWNSCGIISLLNRLHPLRKVINHQHNAHNFNSQWHLGSISSTFYIQLLRK